MNYKHLLLLFFIQVIVTTSVSQNQETLKKLQELNLKNTFMDESMDTLHYSFIGISTTGSSTMDSVVTKKVKKYSYNPLNAPNKYQLLSVNDSTPKESDIKEFKSNFGKSNTGKIDPEDLKFIKEDATYVVFSFKYNKKSLSDENKVLAKCEGEAYINKNTKRLELLKFYGNKPIKVKIAKITKLYFEQHLDYKAETNSYVAKDEYVDMELKVLFLKAREKETTIYQNYIKVQ